MKGLLVLKRSAAAPRFRGGMLVREEIGLTRDISFATLGALAQTAGYALVAAALHR